MSASEQAAVEVRAAIETAEEAYEFMLAYAAQGRQTEAETEGASQIRGFLERFRKALDSISDNIALIITPAGDGQAFADHVEKDTAIMKSVLDLLLAGDNISSDMIDNTNGMIAVRSFLTNLFFIDQVVLPPRQ